MSTWITQAHSGPRQDGREPAHRTRATLVFQVSTIMDLHGDQPVPHPITQALLLPQEPRTASAFSLYGLFLERATWAQVSCCLVKPGEEP